MSTEAFECCIGREEKAQINCLGDLSSQATVPKNSSYCDVKSEETQKKLYISVYEKAQLVEYLLSYEQRRLEYDLTE